MYSNLHLIACDTRSFRRSVKVEKRLNLNWEFKSPIQIQTSLQMGLLHNQPRSSLSGSSIYFPFSPHTLSEGKESSSDSKWRNL